MWKSGLDVDRDLDNIGNAQALTSLYGLSTLGGECIFPAGYQASEDWPSSQVLTAYGAATLEELRPVLKDLPEPDIQAAVFIDFYHHELYIDYDRTEPTKIQQILERELLQEKVYLPYAFDRILYDRFNDNYSDTRTDHLMGADVQKLLQGTPVGICQLGQWVPGPLGVLRSQETRYLPAPTNLRLWHCSDTGCNALHTVRLMSDSVGITQALSRIRNALLTRHGPASEWHRLSFRLHGPRSRAYVDLPAILADCVIGSAQRY